MRYGRRTGLEVDADRLRTARLAAGLSLSDIAGDKVSRTMVHFAETGRAKPSRDVLKLIARRIGKPVSYFLVPDDEPTPGTQRATSRLAERLSIARREVGRFIDAHQLTRTQREAMTLVAVELGQAAILAESLEKTPLRHPRRKPVKG